MTSESAADAASVKSDDGTFSISVIRDYSTEYGRDDANHGVLFGTSVMGEFVRNEDGTTTKVPSALKIAKAA